MDDYDPEPLVAELTRAARRTHRLLLAAYAVLATALVSLATVCTEPGGSGHGVVKPASVALHSNPRLSVDHLFNPLADTEFAAPELRLALAPCVTEDDLHRPRPELVTDPGRRRRQRLDRQLLILDYSLDAATSGV